METLITIEKTVKLVGRIKGALKQARTKHLRILHDRGLNRVFVQNRRGFTYFNYDIVLTRDEFTAMVKGLETEGYLPVAWSKS